MKNSRLTGIKHSIILILVLSLIPIVSEILPKIWLGTTFYTSIQGVEDTVSWDYVILREDHNQGGDPERTISKGEKVTLTGTNHKRSLLISALDSGFQGRFDDCRNYTQVITANGNLFWVATKSLTVAPAKVLKPFDGWFWAGIIILILDIAFALFVQSALKDEK